MKTLCRWQSLGWAGCGLLLGALTGCQTQIAGMTLPSGRYLQHPPQYFAPSPAFPLQLELATMEAQTTGVVPGGPPAPAAAPLPPVVVPPAGGAAVPPAGMQPVPGGP